MLDTDAIRKDFPLLQQDWEPRPPLVYLDNGCMSLKPRQVIDAVLEYYERHSACSGRSVHYLASQVTRRIERSRQSIARFIGAHRPEEVVLLRNTTEALNLVANGLRLAKGDAVVLSDKEHNSNLVPWLRLRDSMGIHVRTVPSDGDGIFSTDLLQEALAPGDVRLVSMVHTNNLDGQTIPLKEVAEISHDRGALVMADAAQSVPSRPVDVDRLGVDLMAFSIHKMLGPTGVGVLWGRHDLLSDLPPYNVGGNTVSSVTRETATFLPPPSRFEAGLQDYAGIYGAEEAVRYLEGLGMEEVQAHEVALNRAATEAVADIPGVTIIGPPEPELRGGVLNVAVDDVEIHVLGMAMDEIGNVAVRSGQHCNHAWFAERGLEGTLRATFYVYNDEADVERYASTLSESVTALRSL